MKTIKLDLIARQRILVILMMGFLSFGGCWWVAKFRGIPQPTFHDEFSYLLAADTFLHGRLTNPTPPMWEHFETFHELMRPTYMSKFPPGQGLFLAAGQKIFGLPIDGVWLSSALMCMAICWMMYGWVSPRWALAGGLVSVLQFGVFTYWNQSYWGGAVAALGGALIFGALPRIFKYQRLRDVLWLGLGFAFLLNSRPLEGILIGIPVGIAALPWRIDWKSVKSLQFLKKIVVPFGLTLLLNFAVIGAYNNAVTGNPLMFPHVLYEKIYSGVPNLIIEPLEKSPSYHHEIMAEYENNWMKRIPTVTLMKMVWKATQMKKMR